jgi:RNA polymerase-binding protein DksA
MVARRTAGKKTPATKKAAPAHRETAPGAGRRGGTPEEQAGAPASAEPGDGDATGTAAPEATGKAPTGKNATGRTAPARTAAAKRTAAGKTAHRTSRTPAEKTGAKKVAAKKTPAAEDAAVPTARTASPAAGPEDLAVRPGEDPWTPQEVEEARAGLHAETERLRAEIAASDEALNGLMRDSGDSAGDDEADTGTKNITREHEMALTANAREMLHQTERALERLEAGTYGLCENCGKAIGKARVQAFPRATLCVECKQKQERR